VESALSVPLVEVIGTQWTRSSIGWTIGAQGGGDAGVREEDVPGFVGNRLQHRSGAKRIAWSSMASAMPRPLTP